MKIITGLRAESNPFKMPTDAELAQLHAIVVAKYPPFALPGDASEQQVAARRTAFKSAFHALAYLGRRDEPERKNARSLSWWVDLAEQWCRDEDLACDLGSHAFVAALLAHGDIPYAPLERWPFDLSFGLTYGGAGRRATDKWRQVLKTRQLLPPTAPQRASSTNYPTPLVSVREALG